MAAIGSVIDLPSTYSQFGRVRDEYGVEYTVHATELPDEADIGDKFAYRVDIWQNPDGNATTLRRDQYSKS